MALSKVSILVTVTATVLACGSSPPVGDATFVNDATADGGPASGSLGTSDRTISKEVCDDGLDNDQNGKVDDGCACTPGATQPCYLGNLAQAGIGQCTWGTQTCAGSGEFATWGECTGSGAPDADGTGCGAASTPADGEEKGDDTPSNGGAGQKLPPGENPGELKMNIDVKGDCVCAPACPPQAPFVIGCSVTFEGSNSNGCVATAKDGKTYFQEGVKCDEGHLSGFIACSDKPGPGLNAQNCPINKSDPHYASKPSNCPDITNNSTPDKCYF